MSLAITVIGLRRYIERYLTKPKSRKEYAILSIGAFFLLALFKYPNRAFGTSARPDLKSKTPPGWPLLGTLPDMIIRRGDALGAMKRTFALYGPVVVLTIPIFGRVTMVNTPELVQHIQKDNFDNYVKGHLFRSQLSDILGRGIFVSDGPAWVFHRKTAANIFTTKLYRSLVKGAFLQSASDLCLVVDRSNISSGVSATPVDLQALFLKLTLDAFGKLTFGIHFNAMNSTTLNEFGEAFDYLTMVADSRIVNPFWPVTDKIVPGKTRKLKWAVGVLDKYAHQAIEGRRQESEKDKENRLPDLLDHFINYQAEDGTQLSDTELRDVFVNFMVAGRDTTAQQLSWQFYALMTNPKSMVKLVQEIDRVLEGEASNITYENLMQKMPYAQAVFHETLRLYTPVPKNVKEAVADDYLPDGTFIKKGDHVGFSTWCMGRNPDVWGPNAELFVPERWLESVGGDGGEMKFKRESTFKFNSFNAGPRICLGQTFATLESIVTTCVLLQRYSFRMVPGQPTPKEKGSVTLPMKDSLLTIVTPRKNVEPFDLSSLLGTTLDSRGSVEI